MTDETAQAGGGVLPPSAPPPPAAEEQPKTESADSLPAATDPNDSEPKRNGYGKRIDELTRLRRDAERDRDHWRELAMRSQQPAAPQKQANEPAPTKTLADFGWDEKAFARHIAEQAMPKPEAIREQMRELQEEEIRARRADSFRSREADFAKDHEDYEEVAHYAPISDDVADMIQDAEEGPELAYYLGKNPDVARKISKLPYGAAGVELGKLAAKLAVERAKASEPSVSKAPAPTPKIKGASDAGINVKASSAESDKLSDEAWMKARNKELRNKD